MLPIPLQDQLLIEPIYDPEKIGSIYMPPAAQDIAPSQGIVVAVGALQKEVEVGFRVILTTREWVKKSVWKEDDTEYYFYQDREVLGFLTEKGDVYPRKDRVIVRPTWPPSGVVKHGSIYTVDRIFAEAQSPQFGTILRTGESVTTLMRGEVVAIPKWGGYELGVRDRVLYSFKETDIMGILTNAVKVDRDRSDRPRGQTA